MCLGVLLLWCLMEFFFRVIGSSDSFTNQVYFSCVFFRKMFWLFFLEINGYFGIFKNMLIVKQKFILRSSRQAANLVARIKGFLKTRFVKLNSTPNIYKHYGKFENLPYCLIHRLMSLICVMRWDRLYFFQCNLLQTCILYLHYILPNLLRQTHIFLCNMDLH